MRPCRSAALVACMILAACDGTLTSSDERDTGARPDARGETDAFVSPDLDARVPSDLDAYVAPGVDAWAPTGPCATVTCGANQRCDDATGACICLPGFVDSGSSCTAAPPDDPSTRTSAQACAIWSEAHRTTASSSWNEGATECDGGSLPREAIDDTLRRITGYRALVGLGPVVDNPGLEAQQQACAVMMFRNGTLNHMPPMSFRCYTAEGAAGAGSSNLSLGTGTSADTIDLYVDDGGVSSLGHRRWVLNGPLGRVGIGFAGNAGCLSVFDGSGSTARTWISWPPPGPAPQDTTTAWWSFHSTGGSISGATVSMVRVADGMDVTGTVHALPDGYGGSAVAWEPTERSVGSRYRVTVTGGALGEISYEVEIVSCP
ncbi:MAG: CAP domain-containing protein [Sandaracinaceae bacterium]|nr:CAP domain-containing protein [Sandaracinaceae bacterium]